MTFHESPSGNSKPMGTSLLGHPVIPPKYGIRTKPHFDPGMITDLSLCYMFNYYIYLRESYQKYQAFEIQGFHFCDSLSSS